MFRVSSQNNWSIEEYLFAFGLRYMVLVPILRCIPFIPLESGAFFQLVFWLHHIICIFSSYTFVNPATILCRTLKISKPLNSTQDCSALRALRSLYLSALYFDSRALTNRLMLTPSSAASSASFLCTSGGIRTMNLPLYCLVEKGSGTFSWLSFMSLIVSATSSRMPLRASSWLSSSQLKLGNSVHRPTYSWSSSDQVTLYV